ncbi:hypothetical protein PEX2_046760 [Penicillium expansum]|uniref:Uncharacterized protein n=1 Tax=Penicillium expansum TaxID=27334 RepID=A0A0A2KE87_PENEN|nr:hypothetical protein PEX2_046760 [Penicillium expansum]KGO39651.1 hypothetical protein PEXP_048270 [Penicillium expansum]KGO62650.1 hypothetical protein PEX2_046760 [Penicillium expansum]
MCIYWTCKYTLCGCIWDMDPSKCPNKRFCWGPRMITLESNTATCADCWARGDKRVYERQTSDKADKDAEASKTTTSNCESDADGSDNSSDDDEYFLAEEFLSPYPCSRPATPQLYFEVHSELCPVSEDNEFDLTRACHPIDPASMGRDYRARRHKTIPFEDLSDDTDSFVSCEEYLDEDEDPTDEESFTSGNEEDDVYYSMVGPPLRPKGLIKSLEDQSLLLYGSAQKYYPTEE